MRFDKLRLRDRMVWLIPALTVTLMLAAPSIAHGAAWTSEYPYGSVHIQPQTVSVDVFHSAALNSRTASMRIDGVAKTTSVLQGAANGHWEYSEALVDGVWRATWTWVPDTLGSTKATISCYSSILADGLHSVSVTVKDVYGATLSYGWSFTLGEAPTLSAPSPADGSRVSTRTPSISIRVSDNVAVANASATVNGTPVSALLAPGIITVSGYGALPNGVCLVSVTARDGAGNSATRSWSFTVDAVNEECIACHGVSYTTDNAHGPDCASCHYEATTPHQNANHSWLPQRQASCISAGCHDSSAATVFEGKGIDELHVNAASADGLRHSCWICHGAGGTRTADCLACHPERASGHGFSAAMHTASIDASSMAGTWTMALAPTQVFTSANILLNAPYTYVASCTVCHDANLATEHAKTTAAPVNSTVCVDCHPSPRDTVAGAWNKSCTTAGCHATPATSHTTTAPPAPHAVASSLTTAYPAGVGCSASPGVGSYQRTTCHTTDLVQEHNRRIGGFSPYPTQVIAKTVSVSCTQCHSSSAFAALAGAWDGTCDACHDGTALPNHSVVGTARYTEVYARHQALRFYDAGYASPMGVRVSGTNAMDAHGPLRTAYSSGRYIPYGCGNQICHTQFWIQAGLSSYYRPNVCEDCHGANTAPLTPYQGSYVWKSGGWTDGASYATTLTLDLRAQVLPAASSLDFKTYYDIETDWDYGYVQVSTSGGSSWTNLPGTLTTSADPHGQNLGNGLTGSSGGGWVDAHFDLSAYAGQSVLIRFAYICDNYTYGDGWYLDVISVGPVGSPIFGDDVETLKPEWSIGGNRTTKWSR